MRRQCLESMLGAFKSADTAIAPDDKDYSKLKTQMRSLIRMAKEVIEEIEKDKPDDVLISDIACEEMDDLICEISRTVLGNHPAI